MVLVTVVPAILMVTFLSLIPALWAVWASFHNIPLFSQEWQWVGLQNYVEILNGPKFWDSLGKSIIFAGGSVALQTTTGTALALLVNKSFRFSRLVRAVILLPYLIPTVVLGFIALWMLDSQSGIINLLLVDLGIFDSPIPWFGSTELAMPALIITNSWKFTIFVTIFVLARLQSINEGFYEAAEMAGATTYQQFRDITWPNIKGVLLVVVLLRGIFMMNKFDIIWVLTKGGPGSVTTTAPVYSYQMAFDITRLGKSAAISVLLFVVIFFGAIIYFYVFSPEQEVRVE
jgi:multiple sugar transport system permease protein